MRNVKLSKSKIAIIILSILLALTIIGLVLCLVIGNKRLAEAESVSQGNKIVSATSEPKNPDAIYGIKYVGCDAPVFSGNSMPILLGADTETLKLSNYGEEQTTPFVIESMLPGDKMSRKYTITINDKAARKLSFVAFYQDKTVNPTEAQANRDRSLMTIKVVAGTQTIYSGTLADIPETFIDIKGETSIDFTITVALKEEAGNEYQNIKQRLILRWAYGADNVYTIKYTDGVEGEELFPDQIYEIVNGESTPEFEGEIPDRPGYVFTGWTPCLKETVTSDVVYKATWAQLCTIIYSDGIGGEAFESQVFKNVKTGDSTPAFVGTPAREGYTFGGWEPMVSATVKSNVTYTAKWNKIIPEPEKYTVIYSDGLGGTIFEDQIFADIVTGSDTPLFVGTPKRDGFVFEGWNPAVADKVTANVTYTAIWSEKVYEGLEITEDRTKVSSIIEVVNPTGGKRIHHVFGVTVNVDDHDELLWGIDGSRVPDELAGSIVVRIVNEKTGEVLYEGTLDKAPTEASIQISGERGEIVKYYVELTVDESVGEQYADALCEIGISWWVTGICKCCLCRIVRYFGGPYCICPWCWIILVIILILLTLYHIGMFRNRKFKKILKENNATKEDIKAKTYRRISYIWLGIKTIFGRGKMKEDEAKETA